MFFLAEASPEYEMGYKFGSMIGALIPVLFLVVAVIKHFEPNRNKNCSLAMVLFLSGWGCSTVGYALVKLTGADRLLSILGFVGLLSVLVGIVFAIMGLVELSKSPKHQVGGKQAIWSLVLSAFFLVAFAVGFFGALGKSVPDDWKMAQPLPGSRVSVVPKNFSLAVPGSDWVQVVPTKLNPMAELAFVQPKKQIYVIVLAHQISVANLTLATFAEAARGELKQADPAAVVSEAQPLTVNGGEGAVFNADLSIKGQPFSYREWVSVQGGVAYQVLAWGLKSNAPLIRSEADRIIGTFETLTRRP